MPFFLSAQKIWRTDLKLRYTMMIPIACCYGLTLLESTQCGSISMKMFCC